jgi:tetratricopeptide (TPR) repeat protein
MAGAVVFGASMRAYLAYSAVLLVITLFAYAPVRHYGFISFDDPQYIANNPNVTAGLTWHGVKWAFTTGYQANWHPLTWLSHMLDIQLFGANPGAHHRTNLVFHIANTLLLLWFLIQVTGRPGASAFAAALFAVHPLHVESVAWIAERKDILSTFFGLLALCAYASYVRRPRIGRYVSVLGFFALSLMSKPMMVTLPFVLLLLDFWPLHRFTLQDTSRLPRLILEKIPLLILTGISSLVTFFVQKAAGAVVDIPAATRFTNGLISYFSYLQRLFWPVGLSAYYPIRNGVQSWWWPAALGLIGLSIFAVWIAQSRPWIPVGWFWYLGTLVPVIGFVKVGTQATANRYTYVPLIGVFLIIAFGTSGILSRLPHAKSVLRIASTLAIIGCVWGTRMELQYWSDSASLWAHALNVTHDNVVAQFNLAAALWDQGKFSEAISHYAESARMDPTLRTNWQYVDAQYGFGAYLINLHQRDKLDEAAVYLTEAVRGKPDFPEAHNALGIAYMMQGKMERAGAEFSEAIRLKPGDAGAHNNLGTVLGNQGHIDEAIAEYTEAVHLNPGLTDARVNLEILKAKERKASEGTK